MLQTMEIRKKSQEVIDLYIFTYYISFYISSKRLRKRRS